MVITVDHLVIPFSRSLSLLCGDQDTSLIGFLHDFRAPVGKGYLYFFLIAGKLYHLYQKTTAFLPTLQVLLYPSFRNYVCIIYV